MQFKVRATEILVSLGRPSGGGNSDPASLVEEQGAESFEDVRLAGVVLAVPAACFFVLHQLEHRPEDRGADGRPAETRSIEQDLLKLRRGRVMVSPSCSARVTAGRG